MSKAKKIEVLDTEIRIITSGHQDYISLTDMLKAKDDEFTTIRRQSGSTSLRSVKCVC